MNTYLSATSNERPTFSVNNAEFESLYSSAYKYRQLRCFNDVDNKPKFLRAGVVLLKMQLICCKKWRKIMAKKMTGVVTQFGTKGYGFIAGDDGEKYFVHQKNVYNKSRLRGDARVEFKIEASDKGLVAMNVKLEKTAEDKKPLTDSVIKLMFTFLLIMQIITSYYTFFK